LFVCLAAATVAVTGGVGDRIAHGAVATDWPMFQFDATHSGNTNETEIGASNAATLGVAWQADVGGSIFSSPAVVYNQKLGERVVYVGYKHGVNAYDAATGTLLWHRAAGRVESSPAVVDGVLYVGSANHYFYALNAANGRVDCRYQTTGVIAASPVVANPDGTGEVVYFGDSGPSGGKADGGSLWALNAVDPNTATDCSVKWQFNSFISSLTGVWSSPAYAVDKNGTPLVVFGTSDPDDSIVAVNASTGQQQWVYFPLKGKDSDVGSSPTISLPGNNGIADGAVYIGTKYGYFDALDLTTGGLIWDYNARPDNVNVSHEGFRSTAALAGSEVYVGSGNGVYAWDAVTGTRTWFDQGMQTVASPAITGAPGDQVAIIGDGSGTFHALSLATGADLWTMASGSPYLYSSAAISNGTAFVGTPGGVLYALAPTATG
jgi:outer membrane protein assembly factor BamB